MIQIGNGNWAVKEDNLLGYRYDETEGVYFPREMTFGRACDATRVNPDGLIERVPYNLLQYSEQFNQSNWAKFDSSATANAIAAPNGTTTADKFVEGTGSSIHRFIQGASIIAGQSYVFSSYAKAGERTRILVRTNNGSSDQDTYFDLSSGSVVSGTGTITDAGNGWYKISRIFTATTSTTSSFICQLLLVNTGTNTAYTGDGTSGVYIWGAQLVEGTESKPYFPTTNRQDIARIDYSSGTGALLLEPQRTNLVTYDTPSNFSASVPRWTNGTNNPAVINQAVGIYGTETATMYTKTSGQTTGDYFYFQQLPVTSGSVYAVSGYIKLGTASNAVVVINNTGAWDSVVGANFVATAADGYDEWKRFEITFTAPASNKVNIHLGYHMETGVTAQADGTFFVQGVQLELGSYATSIIQTNGTSVTRLADAAYKTGISSLIGQTEGTLFVDFEIDDVLYPDNKAWVSIDDQSGAANNRIIFYMLSGASTARYQLKASGVTTSLVGSSISNQTQTKIAIAYKSGDIAVYKNGVLDASSTNSLSFNASMDRFTLNYSGYPFVGKLNQATIYKTRLSNSELEALTTI